MSATNQGDAAIVGDGLIVSRVTAMPFRVVGQPKEVATFHGLYRRGLGLIGRSHATEPMVMDTRRWRR